MILAHWTYSKQEWKAFVQTEKKQNGLWFYLHCLLSPIKRKIIPEIKITPELVSIGVFQHYFNSGRHSLKQIKIREAGTINILEITFQYNNAHVKKEGEIKIPVPKGKLREAIEIEEKLLTDAMLF